MHAENRWWVIELLAADCEKAWTHPGWEDNHAELVRLVGKNEKEDEDGLHQQKVEQMIRSAWEKCWTLA